MESAPFVTIGHRGGGILRNRREEDGHKDRHGRGSEANDGDAPGFCVLLAAALAAPTKAEAH